MSEQCPYCQMTRDYFAIEDECCHEYEVNRLNDKIKRYKQALEDVDKLISDNSIGFGDLIIGINEIIVEALKDKESD